jgi:DNA polymerase-3 subunit delta'
MHPRPTEKDLRVSRFYGRIAQLEIGRWRRDVWPVIGHNWAVELLWQGVRSGRLGHAYLFVGPGRVGKMTLAKTFTQAIECETADRPCGTCRNCQLVSADKHPDVLILSPEKERIRIESIRELQHSVSLSPVEGRYRVCIIGQIDQATLAAANSLLKTLEEPPPKVVLLLTADQLESVLPTIVSRCQVIHLRPLSTQQVVSALQARGVAQERASLLGHLARGRMGWAIQAAEDEGILQERERILSELVEWADGTYTRRFAWAQELSKQPERVPEVLDVLASWWRDVLILSSGSRTPIANIDRHAQLAQWSARYGIGTARQALESIRDTVWRLAHNANVRLALEVLALDMPGAA